MRCSEPLAVVKSTVGFTKQVSVFATLAPAAVAQLRLVRSMRRFLLILLALGIGTLVTTMTTALSYFAFQAGAHLVSEILFWPNTLMQSLVPVHNIGTPEHSFYEGTPVNIAAFFVSFPLGILVYSAVAYIFVRRRQYGLHTTQNT
jgi:accessory gene regulator protein AgrB